MSTQRILWLDHDAEGMKPYRDALMDQGVNVGSCVTIHQAVEKFQRDKYCLVIWNDTVPLGEPLMEGFPENDAMAFGGITFYRWLLQQDPAQSTLLFTFFRAHVPDFSRPDRRQFAAWKGEYDPPSLVSFVSGLIHLS